MDSLLNHEDTCTSFYNWITLCNVTCYRIFTRSGSWIKVMEYSTFYGYWTCTSLIIIITTVQKESISIWLEVFGINFTSICKLTTIDSYFCIIASINTVVTPVCITCSLRCTIVTYLISTTVDNYFTIILCPYGTRTACIVLRAINKTITINSQCSCRNNKYVASWTLDCFAIKINRNIQFTCTRPGLERCSTNYNWLSQCNILSQSNLSTLSYSFNQLSLSCNILVILDIAFCWSNINLRHQLERSLVDSSNFCLWSPFSKFITVFVVQHSLDSCIFSNWYRNKEYDVWCFCERSKVKSSHLFSSLFSCTCTDNRFSQIYSKRTINLLTSEWELKLACSCRSVIEYKAECTGKMTKIKCGWCILSSRHREHCHICIWNIVAEIICRWHYKCKLIIINLMTSIIRINCISRKDRSCICCIRIWELSVRCVFAFGKTSTNKASVSMDWDLITFCPGKISRFCNVGFRLQIILHDCSHFCRIHNRCNVFLHATSRQYCQCDNC